MCFRRSQNGGAGPDQRRTGVRLGLGSRHAAETVSCTRSGPDLTSHSCTESHTRYNWLHALTAAPAAFLASAHAYAKIMTRFPSSSQAKAINPWRGPEPICRCTVKTPLSGATLSPSALCRQSTGLLCREPVDAGGR